MSKQDQFKHRQIIEFIAGRVSRRDTAKLLKLTERTISRLTKHVKSAGLRGVLHGNRGRKPHNKLEDKLKTEVQRLVTDRYHDFNMLHCLEILKVRHNILIRRETFRKWCHEIQMVKRRKKRRSFPRQYRSRMPAEGYLLQMDGSPHKFNGRTIWSLIIAIDDATSEIAYGEFFHAETTWACMKVLAQIILKKGIPRALYVDKAGWAGGGKRVEFTQFHRACAELGIQVLYANSPEAKGRVERAFNTIQDRIIPEFRINRITAMQAANDYFNKKFLRHYWNKRNVVEATSLSSEYRPLKDPSILKEILCYKNTRKVDYRQCISLNGDTFQVRHPNKMSLSRREVEIRFYDDKSFAIYFQNTKLSLKLIKKYKKIESTWHEDIKRMENMFGIKGRFKLEETNSLGI